MIKNIAIAILFSVLTISATITTTENSFGKIGLVLSVDTISTANDGSLGNILSSQDLGGFVVNNNRDILPATSVVLSLPNNLPINITITPITTKTVKVKGPINRVDSTVHLPKLINGKLYTKPTRSKMRDIDVATTLITPIISIKGNSITFATKMKISISYNKFTSQKMPKGEYYDAVSSIIINNNKVSVSHKKRAMRKNSRADISYTTNSATFSIDMGIDSDNETNPEINQLYKVTPEDLIPIFGSTPIAIGNIALKASNRDIHDSIAPSVENLPKSWVDIPYFVIEQEPKDLIFNGGDKLYFYGEGANYWYNQNQNINGTSQDSNSWEYRFNYYDYHRYYWISTGVSTLMKKTDLSDSSNVIANPTILRRIKYSNTLATKQSTYTNDNSDREWIEFAIKNSAPVTKQFNTIVNAVPNSDAYLKLNIPRFQYKEDSNILLTIGDNDSFPIINGDDINSSYRFNSNSESFSIEIRDPQTYAYTHSVNYDYLDFESYDIMWSRSSDLTGLTHLLFNSAPDKGGYVRYNLTNLPTGPTVVLRINSKDNTVELLDTINSSSYTFSDSTGLGYSYLIQQLDSALPLPTITKNSSTVIIDNQYQIIDCKNESTRTDYLIISAPEFLKEAVEIAKFKKSINRFSNPKVISTVDIFRDFGGALSEPSAIRNMLIYGHEYWDIAPDYVLLFGNGNYDYKKIKNELKCFIPPYIVNGKIYEDFFASINEGDNVESAETYPSIFIGRVTIKNETEAANYLEKLKKACSINIDANRSEWRNRVLLISDDDNQGLGEPDSITHFKSSDSVGVMVKNGSPYTNILKLNMFEYPLNAAYKKPAVKSELINQINNGLSLWNYFGHGNTHQLADEDIFDLPDLDKLTNSDNINIFTALSCSIGFFDLADFDSLALAPEMVVHPNGAIATIASSRVSYANSNTEMAIALFEKLYSSDTISIGQAYIAAKKTKNLALYALFGDPSYRPFWTPKNINLKITTLNGDSLSVIKRLQKVIVKGTLPTSLAPTDSQFITLHLQNPEKKNEHRKDGGGTTNWDIRYRLPGEILYNSTTKFAGNSFEIPITIPYYMKEDVTGSQLRAYIWNEKNTDISIGYNNSYTFKGIDVANIDTTDKIGPTIAIRLQPDDTLGLDTLAPTVTDNRIIIDGFNRNSGSRTLEIFLTDKSGIDHFNSMAGEGIIINIDGIMTNRNLNSEFSQIEKDNDGKGKILLDISRNDVPAIGEYNLDITVRDFLGNITKERYTLEIKSLKEEQYSIGQLYCYPSPVKMGNSTRFYFNAPSSDVSRRTLKIFTLSGKLIRVFKDVLPGVTWDLRDQAGNKLSPNVYLYRLFIERDKVDANNLSNYKKDTEVIRSDIKKMIIYPPN